MPAARAVGPVLGSIPVWNGQHGGGLVYHRSQAGFHDVSPDSEQLPEMNGNWLS